jgi:NADP-dependent 3-hydroxy acid dehydrogenase YdfG
MNLAAKLSGCVAAVTGASSGIGKAIALALAREGAQVCVAGRNPDALRETAAAAQPFSKALSFPADLSQDDQIELLAAVVREEFGRLDILVHSAGLVLHDRLQDAPIADFDCQYAINVRAPYLLTQAMLPALKTSRGQIVFINSSVGVSSKRAEIGQYAATKHALKAVADSLREEVNAEGIRVLTVYCGRTATPRQEKLHAEEHKAYRPELLLQPEDVASVVIHSLTLPRTAEVTDIHIRPMIKS